MSKSQEKQQRQNISSEQNRVQGQQNQFQSSYVKPLQNQYSSFTGNYVQPAQSGYQNFASTGGFSPGAINNLKSQQASNLSSAFGTFQDQLNRNNTKEGGYSPGMGSATSSLARQAADAQNAGLVNSNIAINQAQNQNKLAGLGGLNSVAGTQLGNLGGQNQVAGTQLSSVGLTDQDIASLLGQQTQLATRPGAFGNLLGFMGAAGGLASGVGNAATGAANLGFGV